MLTSPPPRLLSSHPACYLLLFPIFIIHVGQDEVDPPHAVPEEHGVSVGLQFVRLDKGTEEKAFFKKVLFL